MLVENRQKSMLFNVISSAMAVKIIERGDEKAETGKWFGGSKRRPGRSKFANTT